ncbi:MAG: ribosome silencing factor [Dehalococcoidia bacterium]
MVELASEKQAADIVLLDIREVAYFADYFVIMNAESQRQMRALQEEVLKSLKGEGTRPHHVEGTAESGWLLLDFGDVIVHIFAPEQRAYYQLDQLWARATPVVRVL